MADNMIRIGADVSGVEAGVAKAKKSIHSLTVSVEQGGRRISAGMKPSADGAAAAASGFEEANRRMERSLKSMQNAIQRDIAMKEAGERGTRRYYEALAAQRGIPTAALNPYLSQLDKVNGKVRAGGISIAQFNNALRQTPAQMTDIVTQLAGGQNPMLIMLQQGGQLRDMYGGLRPKMQKWQVRLVGKKAVIEQVKAFLDARRGVEAFYWQPDGHPRLLVKAAEYRETPRGGKVYELSAEFEEVLA